MSEFLIDKLLVQTVEMGASDLYLVPEAKPTVKVDGRLVSFDTRDMTAADTSAIVRSLCPESYQVRFQEAGMVDFAFHFSARGRSFRVNAAKEVKGDTLTLRLISNSIPSPSKMGFPPQVLELLTRPQGLLLVTGPTGSGKSTTLAAFMEEMSQKLGKAISTVEQPIEFQISQRKTPPVSIVRQFEVPQHVHSFQEALRGILRQAPDVIMVGELRDFETMEIALHAAETGHLVLCTLHTNSAAEAISRMVNVFPADRQEQVKTTLGAALVGIIAQRLLPHANGKGRVLAYETLLRHPALPNLIHKGALGQLTSLIQTNRKLGMRLFDEHLLELFNEGKITAQTALEFARDPKTLQSRLNGSQD